MKQETQLSCSVDLAGATIVLDEKVVQYGGLFGNLSTEILTNHYRQVMDTKDAMIREALIKLGWTPPPESMVLHSARQSHPLDLKGNDDPT